MNYNNQTKETNKRTLFSKKKILCALIIACTSTSVSAMFASHLKEGASIARKALTTAPFIESKLLSHNQQLSFVVKRNYYVPVPLSKIKQYERIIENALQTMSPAMCDSVLSSS